MHLQAKNREWTEKNEEGDNFMRKVFIGYSSNLQAHNFLQEGIALRKLRDLYLGFRGEDIAGEVAWDACP